MTPKTPINFFIEDISFKIEQVRKVKQWLFQIVKSEKQSIASINYILCSDKYLLDINKEYLNHDYYTDIITFQNSGQNEALEADIYISIERVRDNAKTLRISTANEFHRVLVHGILHLIGYKDKTKAERMSMRKKEDSCLSLRDF